MWFLVFMGSFISENILEEIQSRSDIVEVIGSYIPLKRAGANFKAVCPFHNEKTPSFMVSPSKQIFHCFGCGAGGNVFGFLMKYENLSFPEAVRLLAEKAGIEIPDERQPAEEEGAKRLWDLNKFAAETFNKWLANPAIGREANEYLKKRLIKDDIIKKFQIGYAPSGNELLRNAEKAGFEKSIVIQAGLAVKTSSGAQDMFRNRLMFPIYSHTGKVIGFSGRVLDNGLPKYINTPETQIFHKGRILYGLNASRSEIAKQKKAVICEGYFDFLRLYQEGIRFTVASQGTAFTQEQVNLLRRYADEIIVSFDGDAAGSKAALSGLEMFLQEGIQVKVINLPGSYDPDLFVKEKGADAFKELISGAKDILEVKLDRLCAEYPPVNTDSKLKIIKSLLPDMAKIKSDIWRRQFVKLAADRLKIDEDSLWIELKRQNKGQEGRKISSSIEKVISEKRHTGEKYLLQLISDNDPLPEIVKELFDANEIKDKDYRQIFNLLIKSKVSGHWAGLTSLMAYITNPEMLELVSGTCMQEFSCDDKEKAVRDCIYNIKRRNREEDLRTIIKEIGEREKKGGKDIESLIMQVKNIKDELALLEQKFKNNALVCDSAEN